MELKFNENCKKIFSENVLQKKFDEKMLQI